MVLVTQHMSVMERHRGAMCNERDKGWRTARLRITYLKTYHTDSIPSTTYRDMCVWHQKVRRYEDRVCVCAYGVRASTKEI